MDKSLLRPYLVIPKLIEQPTWGGTYIQKTKKWENLHWLAGKKIGQSYELYDKSNLSLATDSLDPRFVGELADSKSVALQTSPPNSIPLSSLVFGTTMPLLLKFTQALGNSFQLHIPDGMNHPKWMAKSESWYYFEPGLITCGVRPNVDWEAYQSSVVELDKEVGEVATLVQNGTLPYNKAQKQIQQCIKIYNPWQYVNLVKVKSGTLLDLSSCGIHHSWEEDLRSIPLGNVLYEIQLNRMDELSTIRNFDKGKMSKDGILRPLQIADYFTFIDRTPEANNPNMHMRKATMLAKTPAYTHELLLKTKYYSMERLISVHGNADFSSKLHSFRHVFVRSGTITVQAGSGEVTVGPGHSVFIPSGCAEYAIHITSPNSEILISY